MPQVGAFPRDSELMESRILFAQGFSSRLDDDSSALAKAEFPRTPSYGKGVPWRTLPQSSSDWHVSPLYRGVLSLAPSILWVTGSDGTESPASCLCRKT